MSSDFRSHPKRLLKQMVNDVVPRGAIGPFRILALAVRVAGTVLLLAPAAAAAPPIAGPADDLLGATVDVSFLSSSLSVDFGDVTIGASGAVDDTPYGYVTLSPLQITIGAPSYVTSTFNYGDGEPFTGFIFKYGPGATIDSATIDPASGLTPTGLLDLFPQIGVNLVGEEIAAGQTVIVDVSGTYTAPTPPADASEPGAIALLAAGLSGLAVAGRRRAPMCRRGREA